MHACRSTLEDPTVASGGLLTSEHTAGAFQKFAGPIGLAVVAIAASDAAHARAGAPHQSSCAPEHRVVVQQHGPRMRGEFLEELRRVNGRWDRR